MKKNLLIAFTTALFPLLAAAQYSVSGKINDKNAAVPLGDVRITVLKTGKYVQSTASGDYKLDSLKATRKAATEGWSPKAKAIANGAS